jgi:hypothetical protein
VDVVGLDSSDSYSHHSQHSGKSSENIGSIIDKLSISLFGII